MMKNKNILIGWASRDVTPYGKKVSLRGQFHVRITEEVKDPITTTALVLDDGKEQSVIVSLDAVGVSDYVTNGCREAVKKRLPGLDPSRIFISATHTHTAPEQPGAVLSVSPGLSGDIMGGREYGDFLIEKISDAVMEAWNSRKSGALSWGKGNAVVGYNRRVSYFDGSSAMYGKTDVPQFSHIEGYEDHGVDMLFTYDSGHSLTGMLLNVPCPAQCTEGEHFISADYWNEVRREIWKRYGESIFILPQCAAAGDQSPRTMVNRKEYARMLQLKYGESYDHARRFDIGVKIATAVDEALPLASKEIHDEIILAHKVDRIEVPRRIAKKEDYDNAGREVETNREKLKKLEAEGADALSREYSSAYRRVGFNEKIVELYKRQRRGEDKTLPVELHSLRIGDVAMCTNCFEYFLDFGLRIKCRVKALQTFIAQLTGEGTYLPTERGMKGGSYGAYIASTPIGPEGGRVIAEQQIKTVNGMFEK